MQRWSKFFLLLASGTLFYRRDIFSLIKPFEIFILLAAAFAAFYFFSPKNGIKISIKSYRPWLWIFALTLFFSIIGTINGYRVYGIADPLITAGGFFYLLIDILAFFLVIYFGREPAFRNKLLASFYSPLIFTPFIFFPQLGENFISDSIHFYGLHKNPTTFGFLAFFTLTLLIANFIKTASQIRKFFYWLGILAILALIIWSGSRAAWLATAIAIFWTATYLYKFYRQENSRVVKIPILVSLLIIAVISVLISFTILPHRAKIMALDRLYPQITNYLSISSQLNQLPIKSALIKISEKPIPSLPYQAREKLWPQAVNLLIKNPLGLGIEYFRSAKAMYQGGYATHSHNTFLQAGLAGGFGLLFVYLFMIGKIAKLLIISNKDLEWFAISTMALGSFVFLMIGELLYIIPWIWIMMAIAAVKNEESANAIFSR